jgi:phosphatidylglycerophosphatase A
MTSLHEHESASREPGKPAFLTRLIATGFFVGYIPWASGTFGSIVGCLFLLIPGLWDPRYLPLLTLLGFAAGVVTGKRIALYEGNRLNTLAAKTKALFQPQEHTVPDPSMVVIDEIVGMWISCMFISPSLIGLVVALFFFRLFDVVKPPPAQRAENIPNGWGIMLDDVVAGVYANVATRGILWGLAALGII